MRHFATYPARTTWNLYLSAQKRFRAKGADSFALQSHPRTLSVNPFGGHYNTITGILFQTLYHGWLVVTLNSLAPISNLVVKTPR